MRAALARREFLAGLSLLSLAPAAHAELAPVTWVTGDVSAANFRRLEAFLVKSLEAIVGLDLKFRPNDQDATGQLAAFLREDELVVRLPGPDAVAELVIKNGINDWGDTLEVGRFYLVSSGGMQGGIATLILDNIDVPPNLVVNRVAIDALDAGQ